MRLAIFILLYLYFSAGLVFQVQASGYCGNEKFYQHISPYPQYLQDLEYWENQVISQRVAVNPDSVLYIPVVFHVLHTGEPLGSGSNISEARILAALQTTNREWNDSTDRGAYLGVRFCLAQTDPNGNPTNGIVRIDASDIPQYESQGIGYGGDPGASETALKQLSNWPHDRYYNIWVVNKIAGGWAGFAYYPTGSNFSNDGTIIAANSVKSGNEVLAHELGHGLGLYHTFQGGDNDCPANDNCTTQGDRICDTPPHKTYDCIFSPCASGDITNSTWNIMSYCSLTRQLFTEGQKTRARNAAFTTTRMALLNSTACQYVCTPSVNTITSITCDPDSAGISSDTLTNVLGCDSIIHTFYSFLFVPTAAFNYAFSSELQADFTLLSILEPGTGIVWDFGDGFTTSESNPSHTYSTPGNYKVVLTLSNACGSDSESAIIVILPTGLHTSSNKMPLKIYPNPIKGAFTVEWGISPAKNATLRICNMLGQVLKVVNLSGNKQEIDPGMDLPAGVYTLQFIIDQEQAGTVLLLAQ